MTRNCPLVLPAALLGLATLCAPARAAEHITLRNGFELDCTRHEPAGDRVRLYLLPSAGTAGTAGDMNYIELKASEIAHTEPLPDPLAALTPANDLSATVGPSPLIGSRPERQNGTAEKSAGLPPATPPSAADLHGIISSAGLAHNIDADLLASIIHAESAFQTRAISRAGAQGLMQLMPATAATLGVTDTFAPTQNIGGGTAYLDALLTRYHDNLSLALAAYNAGPAAVDRFHGIPPFTETRAYVARVIREFNRRKRAAVSSLALQPTIR